MASIVLLKIVSQTSWQKKIYSKLKTVKVIRLRKFPHLTCFQFIIRKRVRKTKKYKINTKTYLCIKFLLNRANNKQNRF